MIAWFRYGILLLAFGCSSVTIHDVKYSMSRAQVEKLMGKPDFKETVNTEEIWTYTGTKTYGDCTVTFNGDRVLLPPHCKDMDHTYLGLNPDERKNQDYVPPPIRNNSSYIPSDRKGGDHLILGAARKLEEKTAAPMPVAPIVPPPLTPAAQPSSAPAPSVSVPPSKASQ